MSGNIHVVPKVHSVMHKSTQCHWIIDTGTTYHITPFLSFLQDAQPCTTTLQLPNGATSNITHVGSVKLNSHLTLTNVLCVPSFTYNILSISKLVQDTTYQVVFQADVCYL